MKRHYGFLYILVLVLFCCKKPFNPSVVSSPNSYLVVEGVINSGSDSTIIKLSNTVKLNQQVVQNPVLGAIVTVEGDQNTNYPLLDLNSTGNYEAPSLNLASTQKYRLHVKTASGSEYVSDFVAIKPTPPIDSIGYIIQNGNVNIYVNTHDPSNNTRYYRWEYQETWQFHSKYESSWVLDTTTNTIVPRPVSLAIYNCFGNNTTSTILLNSTAKLSQDVIYQSPVTRFSINAERIETKYSILLKQYALTEQAFEFYQNIKNNTESLGSIFDAQPTQLIGNIHSVNNTNEPVIGFITVTNVQSKRVFLTNAIVPPYTPVNYPYDCEKDEADYIGHLGLTVEDLLIYRPITNIPISAVYSGPVIVGFKYSSIPCVDCTLRGTKTVPVFWK
jgi:hypothetical protein